VSGDQPTATPPGTGGVFATAVTEDHVRQVSDVMTWHTADYITPICVVLSHECGELLGTGTFLRLNGTPYILTNEHVARVRLTHSLSHFGGDEQRSVYRIVHPFFCITDPTDAAITRLDEQVAKRIARDVFPSVRFEPSYAPAHGEILFIHGYPGVNSRFSALAAGVLTRTLPFATPEVPLPPIPDKYDPAIHFALGYPMNLTLTNALGQPVQLPDPHGLSGTLVWDTKFVAKAAASAQWCPQHSRACGLVFAWEAAYHCLVCTRVEYVRSFMLQALRQEAAYFHWADRGRPQGDDLTDWFHAEVTVVDI